MKNFILGFIIAGLIVVVAVGGYYFGTKQNKANVLPAPTLKVVETVLPTLTPIATTTPSVTIVQPTSANDTELIKQALIKKNNWPSNIWEQEELTIKFNDGVYAEGSVKGKAANSVGGGYVYAKKVDGVWKIVADGNGMITCASLALYPDYPVSLISECYDEKTGTSVKR